MMSSSTSTFQGVRRAYLVVFHSPLFKAHLVLIIPNSNSNYAVGTMIHVAGSVSAGFNHKIRRRYDLGQTHRNYTVIEIGTVTAEAIQTFPTFNPQYPAMASNQMEQVALSIPAPGPSLRSPNTGNISILPFDFVALGLLSPGAIQALQNAPQH
ncbi:hypothetical protein BN946_scf184946.g16 [Trametes cinnabarina]|uniref:Uncharacterized protein n=1 Tax=Pycnoporus cinnabarinus TaxID=5643 RepID=A0A060SYI5_PYCCI|nr:hypothetical protein BN946_scf184946.g16 [Trametes cinnabarina]